MLVQTIQHARAVLGGASSLITHQSDFAKSEAQLFQRSLLPPVHANALAPRSGAKKEDHSSTESCVNQATYSEILEQQLPFHP